MPVKFVEIPFDVIFSSSIFTYLFNLYPLAVPIFISGLEGAIYIASKSFMLVIFSLIFSLIFFNFIMQGQLISLFANNPECLLPLFFTNAFIIVDYFDVW